MRLRQWVPAVTFFHLALYSRDGAFILVLFWKGLESRNEAESMEKNILRLLSLELFERLIRFEQVLETVPVPREKTIPTLTTVIGERLETLKATFLAEKDFFQGLLNDLPVASDKINPIQKLQQLASHYVTLQELSLALLKLTNHTFPAEGHLFLRDALPEELQAKSGHLTVLIEAEGHETDLAKLGFEQQEVLVGTLSVLEKTNPLSWIGAIQPYGQYLAKNQANIKQLRSEFEALDARLTGDTFDALVSHCVSLRLLGPAYYFYITSQTLLNEVLFPESQPAFISIIEPALFYGLNHLSFTHNSLVMQHEAIDRLRKELRPTDVVLNDPAPLSELFRVIEKIVPDHVAFHPKQFDRAVELKDKLAEGTLISSSPVFSLGSMADSLAQKREQGEFSIYETLSMIAEHPHTAREIVTAGWLYKVDRAAVWLFSTLQHATPFEHLSTIISGQDHLLGKSIETAELHRVLLCSPVMSSGGAAR